MNSIVLFGIVISGEFLIPLNCLKVPFFDIFVFEYQDLNNFYTT